MRDALEGVSIDPRKALVVFLALVAGAVVLGVIDTTLLGTIAIVAGILVMVMLHEAGHFVTAKWSGMKVTEFFVGFGPRLWSVRRGETEYGLKAIPAGGYVRIVGMHNLEEVDPADEARAFRSQPYRNKMLVLCAGSATHFVLAIAMMIVIFAGLGIPTSRPVIREVVAQTPAAGSGLRTGDRIVALDGVPVRAWDQVVRTVQGRAGTPVRFTVERAGRTLDVTLTPEARPLQGGGTAGFAGIGPVVTPRRWSLPSAVVHSFSTTGGMAKESLFALGRFFSPSNLRSYTQALSGERTSPDVRFYSPVGATRVASEAVKSGLRDALWFLVLINVFVGTLNLLPLPPLDGGHAAVATYERIASLIRRRPVQVDMAKVLPIATAVVALLLFIGVSALYLDIVAPMRNPF